MVATLAGRDARLWEEESFEARLDTGGGKVFRFVLNPLGAQFDSHDWDPGWTADWQAAARTDEGGWTAEMAIPFATLGVTPRRGTAWKANFLRTRHNVTRERSSWAPVFGLIEFE